MRVRPLPGLICQADLLQLVMLAQDWITENHLKLPNLDEVVPNLMEQMAQREQAQRDVSYEDALRRVTTADV